MITKRELRTKYLHLQIEIKTADTMSNARANKALDSFQESVNKSLDYLLGQLKSWEKENEEKILEAGR